jgi:hypothetical protein
MVANDREGAASQGALEHTHLGSNRSTIVNPNRVNPNSTLECKILSKN